MGRKEFRRKTCEGHTDCFANVKGQCVCLTDTDMGGKRCPFYKSNRDIDMDSIMNECRIYANKMRGE